MLTRINLRMPGLVLAATLAAALPPTTARAAEGASVYPAGVETILPGLIPPSGGTMFLVFNNFYQANGVADSNGHSIVPGFHLRVGATAFKLLHSWGGHFLGGSLSSFVGVPVVYEHLDAPFGKADKVGLGNIDIGAVQVSYNKGNLHFWYGLDAYTPGGQYNKNDLINIGEHYGAFAPDGAFTYLPGHGKAELSSKFQYIVNFTNPANNYRSGRELVWEYAAMRTIVKNLAVGVNGYSDFQTSDDRQDGLVVADGNRGRVLAVGPEIRYHAGHVALILKYQKEMLVENRPIGNSFWFQLGLPLGHKD